jgi:hypothetical protein
MLSFVSSACNAFPLFAFLPESWRRGKDSWIYATAISGVSFSGMSFCAVRRETNASAVGATSL